MTFMVGIYIYDEVEVMDFAGPFQVFTTATRVYARAHPDNPELFEVMKIAVDSDPIRARGGLKVLPSHTLYAHSRVDLLIVPGGIITVQLKRQPVIEWISRISAETTITASVCTGAFLLAKAGLLDGKRATTHWEDIQDLRAMFPQITVVENQRWVDEGWIVTSAGISAGIDMSLYLVERLVDH
jgi:transcriptional regulator GlxA family with amidase domain